MVRVALKKELQINWVSFIADFMLVGMVFTPVAPFLAASGVWLLGVLRTLFISWVIMCVRNQIWA